MEDFKELISNVEKISRSSGIFISVQDAIAFCWIFYPRGSGML
jgi:hypothetical protein